jgi:hypothetical protein
MDANARLANNCQRKIDKKALPEPDVAETLSNKFVVPRNETEQHIADIWKDLLA